VTKGGQDDFFAVIEHTYEIQYLGLSKKTPIFYSQWFDPTQDKGTKVHSKYNIIEIKMFGRYI